MIFLLANLCFNYDLYGRMNEKNANKSNDFKKTVDSYKTLLTRQKSL